MKDNATLRNFVISDHEGRYETTHPISEMQILNAARTIIRRRHTRVWRPLESPTQTKVYLMLHLGNYEHEVFACLFLDNKHRVLAFEEMFRGTINGAKVYPREVVKKALEHNAAAVVFAHNHPSGNAQPSMDDKSITYRLIEALALVDVKVLDHIVIGGDTAVSFVESGLIECT